MEQKKTKSLVQGAMIAALFGTLSLFNTYTGGMIDIFICYFMVVPLAWYGYQYNIKMNSLVAVSSFIVILLAGTPFFVISSFSCLAIGVFLGEMIRRNSKKEIILLGTFIICVINNILIYQVFSHLLGMDMVSEIQLMIDEIKIIYPSLNSISDQMIVSIIPMVLLLMSGLEMYVIILICQLIFMRLKIPFPSNFHIATMHLSKKTGIISGIVMLSSYISINMLNIEHIMINYIFILSGLIFILQGFSLINLFAVMMRKRWIVLLSFVLFIFPIGQSLLIILGILDIFSDLRRNLLYNSTN